MCPAPLHSPDWVLLQLGSYRTKTSVDGSLEESRLCLCSTHWKLSAIFIWFLLARGKYPSQYDCHLCQWCLAPYPMPLIFFQSTQEFFLPICGQTFWKNQPYYSTSSPMPGSNHQGQQEASVQWLTGWTSERGESVALGTAVMKGFRGSVIDLFSSLLASWSKTTGKI